MMASEESGDEITFANDAKRFDTGETGGTLASQWKEYFYVDSLPDNVLATKAEKKVKARFGGSRREDDNVISDGSVVAVAGGQCMMIVDQEKNRRFLRRAGRVCL